MTYKSHLEQLLEISIEASNNFISIINAERIEDQSNVLAAQDRWEQSENDYSSFLNHIKTHQVDINTEMPDSLKSV